MVPADTCLAQTAQQPAQIATYKTKLLECTSKTCSQWGRNGFCTFKPVWVSLSPLWGGCCIAGKLPSTPFPRFMWDSPSGGRKKAHSRWFNSAKFKRKQTKKVYLVSGPSSLRCFNAAQVFCVVCDLLMWVRLRHLKLRWAGQIRLHLLTVGKTKLMILINLHKRHISSLISHISSGEGCLGACFYSWFREIHTLIQSLQTGETGGTLESPNQIKPGYCENGQ